MSTTTIIIIAAIVLAFIIFVAFSKLHYDIQVLQLRLYNLEASIEIKEESLSVKLRLLKEEYAKMMQIVSDLEHRNDIEDLAQ